MECREVEKLIHKFVKDMCTTSEKRALLEHIEGCQSCKEELTIQFLVQEGISRLEKGDSFDLNTELEEKLRVKKPRKLRFSRQIIIVLLDLALILGIISIIYWLWLL
ncbi:MAG: zf-HC2 domain-containing protein [Lachnospiraceae bacterium]